MLFREYLGNFYSVCDRNMGHCSSCICLVMRPQIPRKLPHPKAMLWLVFTVSLIGFRVTMEILLRVPMSTFPERFNYWGETHPHGRLHPPIDWDPRLYKKMRKWAELQHSCLSISRMGVYCGQLSPAPVTTTSPSWWPIPWNMGQS